MSQELILGIYVFIMAIFVGFEVISRVPSVLHTPLMSGTNAIHGIVVLGAMLVAGSADTPLLHALGFIAVVFGAANVFGGFVVTDRMLEMFKKRETAPRRRKRMLDSRESVIAVSYIVAAVLFIFGLKRLSSPATARSGNRVAAVGMALALGCDAARSRRSCRSGRSRWEP